MPAAGYPIEFLSVRGLDRRNPVRAMRRGRARGRGGRRRRAACSARLGADAVLGGGGYVAGPGRPGGRGAPHAARADRGRQPPRPREPACSRRSRAACASRSRSRAATATATSSPAGRCRARCVEADRDAARERLGVPPDAQCVLVFGGSLGARVGEPRRGRRAARLGCARAAHHRARATSPRCATRVGEPARLPGVRVPRLARRPARRLRPRGRAGRRLRVRDRRRRQAGDPGPVSARDRRPPGEERALDGGRRRRGGAARRRADAARLRARGRGAARRSGSGSRRWPHAARARRAARRRRRGSPSEVLAREPDAAAAGAAAGELPWTGRKLHFVGIGGAGMSGLALIAQRARRRGDRLRRAETPYFDELRAAGIEPQVGHDAVARAAGHGAGRVDRDPGATCRRSRQRATGARPCTAASCWRRRRAMRRVIAVAGTHGKTTTTAMIAHVLARAARRSGYAVGAELPLPGGGHKPNAVWGSGEWMVVEADESDRSFLQLRAGGRRAHERRARPPLDLRVRARGARGVRRVPRERAPGRHRRRVGGRRASAAGGASSASRPQAGAAARATCEPAGAGMQLHARASTAQDVADVTLPAPGEHNVLNALAALGAARAAGLRPGAAPRAALASLPARGPALRADGRGRAACACSTTTRTTRPRSRPRWPRRARSSRGAWSPCSSRTSTRAPRTPTTSSAARSPLADVVVVLDVYRARERPEDYPGRERQAGRRRGRGPRRRAPGVVAADPRRGGARCWRPGSRAGDLVVTLGAGDVDAVAGDLVDAPRRRAG